MEYGAYNWEVPWNMEIRQLITGRYHGIRRKEIWGGTMENGDRRS